MALPIEDLQELARKKAVAAGIPVEPFLRQIGIESAWNPDAVGPPTRIIDPQTGERQRARGLGQFMPGTARQYGLTNPFDPDANLTASANYMADLLKLAKGDYGVATTMYNFGPGNVLAGKPLPPETQNYRAQIMGGNPAPRGELRAARPEGLREALYNKFFSSLNTGLPETGTSMGEELPPSHEPTLSDLLGGGLTMASLMGGGMPLLAKLTPSAFGMNPFQLSPLRLGAGMAQSLGFGELGGAIGEEVAGQEGRDIGEAIGSNLAFNKMPKFAKEMVAIPPIGPLEGTAVLTKEGLAKPMFHGTQSVFDEFDLTKSHKNSNLYGPGIYTTSAGENVAGGYSRADQIRHYRGEILKKTQDIKDEYRGIFKEIENLSDKFTPAEIGEIKNRFRSGHFDLGPISRISGLQAWEKMRPDVPPPIGTIIAGHTFTQDAYEAWVKRNAPQNIQDRYFALQKLSYRSGRNLGTKADRGMLKEKLGELGKATPNIRPQYLNIKNPFDIDKPLEGEAKRRLYDTIRQADQQAQRNLSSEEYQRFYPIVDYAEQKLHDRAGTITETPSGESVYQNLSRALGKTKTNQLLQQAGFDGITHIGGNNQGNMPHRVHIAFDPKQVIPYFHPELSDVQAQQISKQAEAKMRKELKQLQKQNEGLKQRLNATPPTLETYK